jgi:hypothetical protein
MIFSVNRNSENKENRDPKTIVNTNIKVESVRYARVNSATAKKSEDNKVLNDLIFFQS